MKKLMVTVVVAAMSASMLLAETATTNAAEKTIRKRTPEEIAAMAERSRLRRTGGIIRKANTAHGVFAILNAQKSVAQKDFKVAVDSIDEQIHVQTKIVDVATVNLLNPKPVMDAHGAKLAVVLADTPDMPALITAPESGWAVVNVRALADTDAAKTALRTRREIMRAFALIGGCSFMSRAAILLRDIAEPKELDTFIADDYGVDTLITLERTLPQHGVMPWYQTTYKKACKEGWAPPPTNDYQKAIWDKVHTIPQNPIKIEYDPKAGR